MLLSPARAMRRDPAAVERQLWQLLRDRRVAPSKFRRQQPVGGYIVEADCGQNVDSGYDVARDTWLRGQDFHIQRLWNTDILNNPEGVCTAILVALHGSGPGIAPAPLPPLFPTLPRMGGGSPRSK